MKIKVLNKGDKVLNVTNDLVIIERKNKEVDLIPILKDNQGIWLDTKNIITIGYGNNIVEIETIDGVTITNF